MAGMEKESARARKGATELGRESERDREDARAYVCNKERDNVRER